MANIAETLRMLRDVDGVHGSFVVAGTGALVDSDLPAIFDSTLLGEIGPRIARLYETFFSGGADMETCVLRYAEHKLYVRRMTWGIIAVLSNVGVNLPALRMVANLVIRRIDPQIAVITASGGPPSPPSRCRRRRHGPRRARRRSPTRRRRRSCPRSRRRARLRSRVTIPCRSSPKTGATRRSRSTSGTRGCIGDGP